MDKATLDNILVKHKLWIDTDGEKGEKANLSKANLRKANLRNADLNGADLDYACLPLWCGSLSAKFDKKHYIQFMYHILKSLEQNNLIDDGFKAVFLTEENIKIANQFHRVEECGMIGEDKS